MNTKVIMLMIACLKSMNIWASNYQSPGEAFVVGALSWLLFIAVVYVAKWIIKQNKKTK